MTQAEGANSKDIAKLLKLDQSAAWRRLSAACSDGHIINLEQRERAPGKYRVAGQKPEPVTLLPEVSELAEQSSQSATPKTAHTCIRDEIVEISLGDNVCVGECKPDANGPAYDKSLNGNENPQPYARMHVFSGSTETEDHTAEDYPPVCQHCGLTSTPSLPVLTCSVDGERVFLHRGCQAEWMGDDLAIPEFMRRTEP